MNVLEQQIAFWRANVQGLEEHIGRCPEQLKPYFEKRKELAQAVLDSLLAYGSHRLKPITRSIH